MGKSIYLPKFIPRIYRHRFALGLLICVLGLTGCVYLRLLAIKNQLAQFDTYFRVEATDSFTLHFLEPKLYGKDIVYLSEFQPSQKKRLDTGEEWSFIFKKMITTTEPAPESDTDISFFFRFNSDDLLTSLTFSPALVRIAPPEFLELSIRSLGNAKIDKKNRQIQGDTENLKKTEVPLPKRMEILTDLGIPFSEERVNDTLLLTYHYRLEATGLSPELEKKRLSVAQLYFDPQTDELIRFYGRFAGMKISIHYRKLMKEKIGS